MTIIKARSKERVNMRREQIERYLASDITVAEWCKLNKMAESTFYKWMAYFREHEPDVVGVPNTSKWIELSRNNLSASKAITPVCTTPIAPASMCFDATQHTCITARINGVEVSIPSGIPETDIAAVMRVVTSL